MKNWDEDDGTEYCTAKVDFADAQAVADKLGITLHGANFAAEYWDNVRALPRGISRGRTPNPDILCNREIKFRAFPGLRADAGRGRNSHRTLRPPRPGGRPGHLLGGPGRQQGPELFPARRRPPRTGTDALPLGAMANQTCANWPSNTGWPRQKEGLHRHLFIGERRFRDFLQQYLPAQPGQIRSLEGEHPGEHRGLMYHTIGQRQGLGIGGWPTTVRRPGTLWTKIRAQHSVVAQGNDHPALFKVGAVFAPDPVGGGRRAGPAAAAVRQGPLPPGGPALYPAARGDGYRVDFERPQRQ